jgi:hypothetical protein
MEQAYKEELANYIKGSNYSDRVFVEVLVFTRKTRNKIYGKTLFACIEPAQGYTSGVMLMHGRGTNKIAVAEMVEIVQKFGFEMVTTLSWPKQS